MIEYDKIVPWGRSYTEYVSMFNLSPGFLSKKVLGCGDGPAAFNGVANAFGANVTSIDPIFKLSKNDIEKRIKELYPQMSLLFLDFDGGTSEANVFNRLHFMVENCKKTI